MKLLDKYIAKTVLGAIGLVTLILAGLQIFILFVNQLDDIGKADYGVFQAAFFVLLQMPYQVYLFFPIASLLGSLVGLGLLASNSELVVMRAAGMSVSQITYAVLKAAFVVILLVTIIGETIVPKMIHYSNDYKMSHLVKGQALRTANGIWLREGHNFIYIGSILENNILSSVYQFVMNEKGTLLSSRYIGKIKYEHDHWQAYSISETRLKKNKTTVHSISSMPWNISLKPGVLSVSGNEPDEMNLPQLYRYINEQKQRKQSVVGFRLSYWQRLIQPVTTLVMMILAIPFIFGPLRSSTMGSKLLIGTAVGFGFYIVNRFFGPLSLVYQFPPEISALGPTIIFCLIGIFLMRRVR